MQALFERAMGDEWSALHRKVRERYGLASDDGHVAVGRGVMTELRRSALAMPVLWVCAADDVLFPEAARHVEFTITSIPFVDEIGNEALVLRREFETSPPRTVVDTLRWNPARNCITDVFGRRGLVVADIHLGVDERDLTLAVGTQWFRVGRRYLRVPARVAARGTIRDCYDGVTSRYRGTASITSPLVGEVFGYACHFEHEFQDSTDDERREAAADVARVERLPGEAL